MTVQDTTPVRSFRQTTQTLLPAVRPEPTPGRYDLYPAHILPTGQIERGFDALAARLLGQRRVALDGYAGVLWAEFRTGLDGALRRLGQASTWRDLSGALKPQPIVEALVAPFLGGDDPLFGTRFTGDLADFYEPEQLTRLSEESPTPVIFYGSGAALAASNAVIVYLDLPKNEVQFRARAGVPTTLGRLDALDVKAAYKRAYFVDWPALNAHKARLTAQIDFFVDAQRPEDPTFASGHAVRTALEEMSRSVFRVRPWFEPGPWGGQWIKDRLPELPRDVPNYAWSFELIVPENGLLLEADGLLLELSFDTLMFQSAEAVLGNGFGRFGTEFPIRFDWLDTVQGGNLSLQVHPTTEYTRTHFGETFTQDETYYILDALPGASVYLGFQEGISEGEFRRELERSAQSGSAVNVERYVQKQAASKHELYLIPAGTIHCAGPGNLVLEISATPYIFTFKVYDWQRLGLDGKPRPLNIERAFENLNFSRQGKQVADEFISKPSVTGHGSDWQVVHLPTHAEHFYDVERLEFRTSLLVETGGNPHILGLVEGTEVIIETSNGHRQRFAYAETFVVPASAGVYTLINETGLPLKVIKAFLKAGV